MDDLPEESLDEAVKQFISGNSNKQGAVRPPPHLEKGLASIESFLLWAKLDLEKAAERREEYWKARLELFGDVDIEDPSYAKELVQEMKTGAIQLPLGYHDNNGRQLVVVRPRLLDYSVLTPMTVLKYFWFIMHQVAKKGSNQIFVINDLHKVSPSKNIRVQTLKLVARSISSVLPIRLAGVCIVRQPFFFGAIWSVFSLLLSPKIRSRVKFLGDDLAALMEHFPKSSVPSELGGEMNWNHEDWLLKVSSTSPN